MNRPFSEAAQNRLGTSGITHTATNLAKSLLRSAKLTFPDCLFFKNYFIFFFSLQSHPIKHMGMGRQQSMAKITFQFEH